MREAALGVLVAVGLGALLWMVLGRRKPAPDAGEQRFRAILDTALDAVISMDAKGRIIGWSGQAEAIFGWTADEVLGRPLAETVIPPSLRAAHAVGLERYLRTGEERVLNRRIEIGALRRDGTELVVELAIADVRRNGVSEFSAFVRDITEHKKAAEELRSRQAYLDGLFDGAPEAIVVVDGKDNVLRLNPAFSRLFGYGQAEALGRDLNQLIVPEDMAADAASIDERVLAGEPVQHETVRRHRDGHRIPVSLLAFPIRVDGGQVASYGIYRDVSSRRLLEEQLLHSQKMESIGRLAGGVAHDFNNLLSAILGYLELVRSDIASGRRADDDLAEIERAARRAAELTRQLLAFARRQIVKPQVVDLGETARRLSSLISRLIGEDIHLEIVTPTTSARALVDTSQFEQVLVNLAINARDAMPGGCRLTIDIKPIVLEAARLPPDLAGRPGRYVELAVRDTGVGMAEDTRRRIFEPFFTTKAVGEGTGLGLAMCYGIVKQSGGHITVDSDPGRGTTFRLYFPEVDAEQPPEPDESTPGPAMGGEEVILLVEDEDRLRKLFQTVLSQQGYVVLTASSGDEALSTAAEYQGHIDLLLTDVVLPGMSGREAARRLALVRPGTRIMLMSGYAEDLIISRGVVEPGISLLTKPFAPEDLVRRVREVLDAAPGAAGSVRAATSAP